MLCLCATQRAPHYIRWDRLFEEPGRLFSKGRYKVQGMTAGPQGSSTDTERLLKLLVETPGRIAAASVGLPAARLQFEPDENAWSANDILAHLRACADVWGKSIMAMITQDHPTLRYVSPRTWIRKTNYPGLDFRPSLQAFTRQRQELVESLNMLPGAGWSRAATFTATTLGREQTVLSYVQRMARHEHEHCGQIEALLKPG